MAGLDKQPFSLTFKLEDIEEIAGMLLERLGSVPVWVFDAPMGAGKTTLINQLCHRLGVREVTNSPTFSLVNEYATEENGIIFHIDCYRLDNLSEGYRIGLNEYLESDEFCFVEWPAVVEDMIPSDAVRLLIELDPEAPDRRILTYLGYGYSGPYKYLLKEEDEEDVINMTQSTEQKTTTIS